MRTSLICLLLVVSNSYLYASDDVAKMYQSLRKVGMTHAGAEILLRQARHESHYGKKGVAKYHSKNWWNVTTVRGGNKRIERELRGKRVLKRFAVWNTYDQAAREMAAYLKRKYPTGWKRLNAGDVEGYVGRLKAGGYFTGSKKLYLRG